MRPFPARRLAGCLALAVSALAAGCPSVPQEAVELSYQIGQDLDVLHRSYRETVRERFADFRRARIDYLENEWAPLYLGDWIEEGMLVETARGEVVWSDEAEDFVEPSPGQERRQLLYTVMTWADTARLDIADKRKELLEPLDAAEREILRDLDDSFDRIKRANAHITAHLNSIRKVQEVQQEALDALGLKEVVAELNQGLIDASDAAAKGLQTIRETDGRVDEAVERAKVLEGIIDEIIGRENDGGGD